VGGARRSTRCRCPPAPVRPGCTRNQGFHDTRHSHVGWLIEAGWHLYAIQQRIGHESIKTTFDVYGHRLSHGDTDRIDALDRMLDRRRTTLRRAPNRRGPGRRPATSGVDSLGGSRQCCTKCGTSLPAKTRRTRALRQHLHARGSGFRQGIKPSTTSCPTMAWAWSSVITLAGGLPGIRACRAPSPLTGSGRLADPIRRRPHVLPRTHIFHALRRNCCV
jgi:integrase